MWVQSSARRRGIVGIHGNNGNVESATYRIAEGRVEKTQANIFSADETADVGIDNQSPIALGIGAETRFTGRIATITLELGPAK